MSILGNDLLLAGTDEGYNLTRSLRFRSSASAYLNRTNGSPTNAYKWTFSTWVKRAKLGASQIIFAGTFGSGGNYGILYFDSTDTLRYYQLSAGSTTQALYITSAVYRDVASWYNLTMTVDTTSATATDRIKLYINGSLITAYSTQTTPGQNTTTPASISGWTLDIGALLDGTVQSFFDGYMAETYFVDGQALTPSSFGETDTITGVWKPKRYAGTYGTNGFYLPFTDNSALTTSSNVGLGKDFSGNGNYWTTNNISITAGVTYDSMTDVPTLTSATAANFAVLNPLLTPTYAGSGLTIADGNLKVSSAGSSQNCGFSTIGASSGKFYCEITTSPLGADARLGVFKTPLTTGYFYTALTDIMYGSDGNVRQGENTVIATYNSYTTGDVIGIALDMDSGKVFFSKNGTWQGSSNPATGSNPAYTGLTGTYILGGGTGGGGGVMIANFGQRPFSYTPPTGFVALNTYNLPTSTIVKGNTVMDAVTFDTQSGSYPKTISGLNFKPDLVWAKSRSQAYPHYLFDSVRGTGIKSLSSNSTAAEGDGVTNLSSFNSNGFTVSAGDGIGFTQGVAWQWQAGQGTTSSNTNGTITSTVSVNASAGFSVVTFTAQSSGTGTVGHGLGVAPSLIISKERVTTPSNWSTYHASVGNTAFLLLNTTAASITSSAAWNNTSPTSSVFTLGSAFAGAGTMVAYCWTPIAGYSAFGSYTGNGSTDGPFVYTGFRPKFLMIKSSTYSGADSNWNIIDTARNTYNVSTAYLNADSSSAEGSYAGWDLLSNGFKLRNVGGSLNSSGQTYIYMAFAETPTKFALAR